jgi:hypothetical protein
VDMPSTAVMILSRESSWTLTESAVFIARHGQPSERWKESTPTCCDPVARSGGPGIAATVKTIGNSAFERNVEPGIIAGELYAGEDVGV